MTVRRKPQWCAILCVILFWGADADTFGASGSAGVLSPLAGEAIWFEDFESGWGDWYADNGVWHIGKPTSGPYTALAGTSVAATNLSGNYPYNTDSRLISPVIVLPNLLPGERLELRFWHWFSYAETSLDQGRVEIQTYDSAGWSPWKSLGVCADGVSPVWSRSVKDLMAYAGKVVRLVFSHDDTDEGWPGHRESSGWYIDDVEIWRGVPQFVNPEGFELGWGDWYADNGLWQIGKPTKGPSGAWAGGAVAGTNLSGNYTFDTDSRLISPVTVLPKASELLPGEVVELRFWQWFSYAENSGDHGQVEIQSLESAGWSSWKSLGVCADGASAGWSRSAKDLTAYAGKVVRLAFCHDDTDEGWPGHRESTGWYIDDVEIWRGVPQFVNPEGFELGWGDWYADNGLWQIGKPTVGPGTSHQGDYVAGTNLAGNYSYDTDSRLISRPIQLPSFAQLPLGQVLELRFWQWFSYAEDSGDHGRVEIQTLGATGWSDWKSLGVSASGTSAGWSRTAKDLTGYAGKTVRVAFYHDDIDEGWPGHREGAGWYIDDVEVTGLGPRLTSWSAGGDTGFNLLDKLISDITPELTFVFSTAVTGTNNDVQILDPNGLAVVPDSITGWGTTKIVASFTTPLLSDGRYTIVLKSTLADAEGRAFNAGACKVLHLTMDSTTPSVNDPANLVKNGGFENGVNPPTKETPLVTLDIGTRDLASWKVDSNSVDWMHESYLPDAGAGERFVDFSSSKASKGAVSQVIQTRPGMPYHVWFDVAADPHAITGTRTVLVSAGDASKSEPDASAEFRCATGAQAGWGRETWSFTATGESTTLSFAGGSDPATEYSVAIDNMVLLAKVDRHCGLTISVVGEGTTEPVPGYYEYPCGELVEVKALPDACHPFAKWEGTAVEAGKVRQKDPQVPEIVEVTVDGSYTLTAVFADEVEVLIYDFPLDSDPGWSRTGQWGFGVPKGQGGEDHGFPDPTGGYVGQNVFGVNLNGDHDAKVGGPYCLIAGPFDLSGHKDVVVRFARWLNTDWPEFVKVSVDVSSDDQKTWNSVWTHYMERTEITDHEWTTAEYRLGPQTDGHPRVYVRWCYEVVGERAYAYSGWNIDNVRLLGKCK